MTALMASICLCLSLVMTLYHLILLFVVVSADVSSVVPKNYEKEHHYYKRYPKYPEYCSTPKQLESRKIPTLQPSRLEENTTLVHVTSVIRHGARTPTKTHLCWDGYWADNDTGVWNCSLRTLVSPPTKPEIQRIEKNASNIEYSYHRFDGDDAMFLFEKRYDALHRPPQLSNILNGTCQLGQLILQGYNQEFSNGKMLRHTYIKESSNGSSSIPENMVLFDLTTSTLRNKTMPYESPNLYVRSDDDQRTIMSGSVLISGMLGYLLTQQSNQRGSTDVNPIVVIHTADQEQDILSSNSNICPRLNDLWDEAAKSKEYASLFINSHESRILSELMMNELGNILSSHTKGCLMTTICTDRALPSIVDDFGKDHGSSRNEAKYGKNVFERLTKASFEPKTFIWRYNDSYYSKVATGPLWVEILSNILPFIDETMIDPVFINSDAMKNSRYPPPKFALFSGHDSTILMLLATLGQEVWDGKEWAPYASLLNIEIHAIHNEESEEIVRQYPSRKAFRLLFNGEVLTSRIDGCPLDSELCDIFILLDRVLPFAVNNRDCTSSQCNFSRWPLISWIHLFSISIISAFIGGAITFNTITQRLSWHQIHRGNPVHPKDGYIEPTEEGLEPNTYKYSSDDTEFSKESSTLSYQSSYITSN